MNNKDYFHEIENAGADYPELIQLFLYLTKNELETLYYLSKGFDEKQIVEKMFLGKKSIYKFISSLKEKLNQNTLIALAHYSFEREKIIETAFQLLKDKKQ